MSTPIKVIAAYRTCRSYPAQWDALTDDGRHLYVRFRHGHLTIGSGATYDEAIENYIDVFDTEHGDDGEMEFDELKALTSHVVEWPEAESSLEDAAAWSKDAGKTLAFLREMEARHD